MCMGVTEEERFTQVSMTTMTIQAEENQVPVPLFAYELQVETLLSMQKQGDAREIKMNGLA